MFIFKLLMAFIPLHKAAGIEQDIVKFLRGAVLMNEGTKSQDLSEIDLNYVRCRNVRLTTYDNVKIGAYIIAPDEINEETQFAVLLHGNNSNRRNFTINFDIAKKVRKFNFVVIIPDFRDYGDSNGNFQMRNVVYDIDVCFEVLRWLSNNSKIHIISFSLGTAIALEYMKFVNEAEPPLNLTNSNEDVESNLNKFFETKSNYEFAAVGLYRTRPDKIALVSPFNSLVDIIKGKYEILKMLGHQIDFLLGLADKVMEIDNITNIHFIRKEDLIIIHSRDDELIPIESAITLGEEIHKLVCEIGDCSHSQTFANKKTWKIMTRFLFGN